MTKGTIDLAALQTRRITDFSQIERLYESRLKKDFVRNELKPLSSIRRAWEKGIYECYGLFDGDEILGYAFFIRLGKSYLFDYLAIAEEHRDEGLGSVFLRQLPAWFSDSDCMMIEVEDPDKAADEDSRVLRERRLRFYLRNGYLETALTSTVFGADYRILEVPVGVSHTADELRSTYAEIYRSMLPALLFRTQVHVHESGEKTAQKESS